MDAWLDELAAALGVDALVPGDVDELLDVARDVAHRVERKVTPLAAFLLGAAVQRRLAGGSSHAAALAGSIADLRAQLPAETT